jgi:hypothetical protein
MDCCIFRAYVAVNPSFQGAYMFTRLFAFLVFVTLPSMLPAVARSEDAAGGIGTSSANGGAVAIGDVNSGGNAGSAIGVGDTIGSVAVDGAGSVRSSARYVASDTDLYDGHPDNGGNQILDRRGNPVFADAGTSVTTDGVCGDEWCALADGTYLWGGDLCPASEPATPCT